MKTLRFNVTAFSTTRVLVAVVVIAFAFFVCIEFVFHRGDSREYAQRNACINNLRTIQTIKEQWAAEFKKPPGEVIAQSELEAYVKKRNQRLWECPAGGAYIYGATVSNVPTCSIPDHKLPR